MSKKKLPLEKEPLEKEWKDLSRNQKMRKIVFGYVLKFFGVLLILYLFICSLDLLGMAFRLLGGKTAGKVFQNSRILKNPVAGLMIGVLATVLLQSSSTSTSIVVSLVASRILTVENAIPIIMGTNVGTSLTNTLVSSAHSGVREEFRRAFAGATIHDMFNWLCVLVFLPLELISGYLNRLTAAITSGIGASATQTSQPPKLLQALTEPLVHHIVQLDLKRLEEMGSERISNDSFVLRCCDYQYQPEMDQPPLPSCNYPCPHPFTYSSLPDNAIGGILLAVALMVLIGCLVCIVHLLHSMLQGHIINVIRKFVNSDLPGFCAYFTGFVAIGVGTLVTMLVQSSSVVTSALTPLVGVGVLSLERMFPLTLGANIGTTFTALLAALASPPSRLSLALQISLAHLFFNISGIILWYPIPQLRQIPLAMARALGTKTAKYRWFAVAYVLLMFLVLPAIVFGLSLAGTSYIIGIGSPLLLTLLVVLVVSLIQRKWPQILPEWMRTWDWLPDCLHSFKPWDKLVTSCLKCCKRKKKAEKEKFFLITKETTV